MAYEVFLRLRDKDLSLEAFQGLFSRRKNCRVEDDRAIYENADTGVGFYFEYMSEESKGAPNVRSDGVYRVALCVEYCQPAFFFVEALYDIYDLVQMEDFVVYDPQISGHSGLKDFNDKKIFDSWTQCNIEAVSKYMMSLGPDMDNVPIMPYATLKKMWEWNYAIERLGEMIDKKMQIPTMQTVEFADEDLTAVIWKEGGPIALPYVDIIIFARPRAGFKAASAENQEYEFCAIDYEDVKPLIDKYSRNSFANAFMLEYDKPPKELERFIADLNPAIEFTLMNMCDVLEYEIAEKALLSGEGRPEKG